MSGTGFVWANVKVQIKIKNRQATQNRRTAHLGGKFNGQNPGLRIKDRPSAILSRQAPKLKSGSQAMPEIWTDCDVGIGPITVQKRSPNGSEQFCTRFQ